MKRQRPDRITNIDDFCDQTAEAVYHAIQPLDEVARQMEDVWGINRLPMLVSPETAAKFGSAKAKLDQAIIDNDATEVAKRAAIQIRGWRAMDAEARASGASTVTTEAWTWRDDSDRPHAFVRTTAEATAYAKQSARVSRSGLWPRLPDWRRRDIVADVKNLPRRDGDEGQRVQRRHSVLSAECDMLADAENPTRDQVCRVRFASLHNLRRAVSTSVCPLQFWPAASRPAFD
jgi:hypothetical protein